MSIELIGRKYHTMIDATIEELYLSLPKSKGSLEGYVEDAVRIMDEMSKEFNAIGINHLICLLILLYESGYNGKDNNTSIKISEFTEKILKQVKEVK